MGTVWSVSATNIVLLPTLGFPTSPISTSSSPPAGDGRGVNSASPGGSGGPGPGQGVLGSSGHLCQEADPPPRPPPAAPPAGAEAGARLRGTGHPRTCFRQGRAASGGRYAPQGCPVLSRGRWTRRGWSRPRGASPFSQAL